VLAAVSVLVTQNLRDLQRDCWPCWPMRVGLYGGLRPSYWYEYVTAQFRKTCKPRLGRGPPAAKFEGFVRAL
jgi:hypothetical protein